MQAWVLGRLLQGDQVLPGGPTAYQPLPRGAQGPYTTSPRGHQGTRPALSSSRSPSIPPSPSLLPSHCCFIFRASGSSPKPVTFTLRNENLFYFFLFQNRASG